MRFVWLQQGCRSIYRETMGFPPIVICAKAALVSGVCILSLYKVRR